LPLPLIGRKSDYPSEEIAGQARNDAVRTECVGREPEIYCYDYGKEENGIEGFCTSAPLHAE
jgi:hypothetical protein